MKLKVCGMKHNPLQVARLGPDYLGFIFWEGSARNVTGPLPGELPEYPERVGVFVDALPDTILGECQARGLSGVQLHGGESPGYCRDLIGLLERQCEQRPFLIKAFATDASFDFSALQPYRPYCDYFLFDSRGPLPGGNGTVFDWKILERYPFDTPFFLSGGIGPESLGDLEAFLATPAARFCHAVDVNSRFETAPGLKDTGALKRFMNSPIWEHQGANPNTR